MTGVRLPLVFASPSALAEWRRLAPHGTVLENCTRRLLLEGKAVDPRKRGGTSVLALGDGLLATLTRTRSPSGRLAWLVTAVEAAR